jgi:hypothetical protein
MRNIRTSVNILLKAAVSQSNCIGIGPSFEWRAPQTYSAGSKLLIELRKDLILRSREAGVSKEAGRFFPAGPRPLEKPE